VFRKNSFHFYKENRTMKSKRLFQIFILLALIFSSAGSAQHASASTTSGDQLDAIVIPRDLSIWNATYLGFVSDSIYEKWQFDFNESHTFVVTVTTVTGDLVPLLILLDNNGNEITRAAGSLTSTQPAGSYSLQVQPQSGSGFYFLTLREVVQTQSSVSTVVSPTSVNVGESATATVNLNNVPAEGYTSAEFTCTYDASLVDVSNITVTNLFGTDPAVAINGPQNGSFIVAIAGSSGNKATTSGAAFSFTVTGLQAGQTAIECTVRVSKGDNILTTLPSTGTSLTVVGSAFTPTPTFTPTPVESATPTSTPVESATPTSTPVESATPTSTPVESVTPTETPTETATSTPAESPTPTSTETPTATPVPTTGTLTGQVIASKPVTVSLLNADSSVAASVTANTDGTFSLSAPAGTYTVRATAAGFLSAEGTTTLTDGNTTTMPTVSLLAGDIDGNNVIDQLDAMTIGMNYNASTPAEADLNNDGVINVLDLELLAQNYRTTGPVAWQ
jgi:hypothetical protein